MKHLETITVDASGANKIEFISIPQFYTDLILTLNAKTTRNDIIDFVDIFPNGQSSNASSVRIITSNLGDPISQSVSQLLVHATGANATSSDTFSSGKINISNYRNNIPKHFSISTGTTVEDGNQSVGIYSGLWNDNNPITSLELVPIGQFVEYSTASLYGIK